MEQRLNQILTVSTCGRVDFIALHSIIRIEALSNYSKLFMSNGKTLVVSKVLKLFEKKLDEHCFVRTHKTHLVNMSFVQSYVRGAHATVLLLNGERIPVARNRKRQMASRSLSNDPFLRCSISPLLRPDRPSASAVGYSAEALAASPKESFGQAEKVVDPF